MHQRKLYEVLIVCLLAVAALLAQTPTGGIEGTVTDATGAVLPGAIVTITNASTGQVFNLKTSDAGLYSQQNLDPGTYNVRIEASGFQQTEIRNITVLTGSVANGSVSLKVGSSATTVEVAGQAEAVDTARQTVDTVITTTEIKNLPLFGRNFLDLASLAPGTVVRDGGAIDPTKSNTYRTVGIA